MMQERFKELIKNEIKPFFARHGNSKKNLNFYKAEGTQFYAFPNSEISREYLGSGQLLH